MMWQSWFKYGGVTLLSTAVTLFGAFLAARLRKRKAVRAQLLDLLCTVKNGIAHGALPLSVIYAGATLGCLEKTAFADILRQGRPKALPQALETLKNEVDADYLALYRDFALSLGTSAHPANEVSRCERFETLLRRKEDAFAKEEQARQALYLRMGLIAGLCAALILL